MPLVKDQQGRSVVPLVINDKQLPVSESRLAPVIQASTGEVIHYFQGANVAECEKACDAAWTAFQTRWKRATVVERRNLLLKVADLYEARAEELVRLQKLETSCDDGWAKMQIGRACDQLRETAACISSVKGVIPQNDKPDTMTFVYKEPIGPILVIPPWNAALILSTRAMATAIAAGCTVVLKASELCPATHAMIVDIFRDAGCPAGVINSLQAPRENASTITEALIGDERIRKIDFIGSAAVGRIVASTAAKHLKPCVLELGGKCPAIVLDDADLEKAAVLCAKGAMLHHGQICFGTERIIVHRTVADKFIELLVKNFEGAKGGTAVTERIAENAHNILKDAKDKGAKFLYGDAEFAGRAAVKPALVQIDPSTSPDKLRIVDEETFGPSASVYVVEKDAEAITVANRSAYGLNAVVHTQNLERAIKMGRDLEYGQVHANTISVYTSPMGPQGGVKGSGWGRQNASWGLNEFYVERHISWHGKDSG